MGEYQGCSKCDNCYKGETAQFSGNELASYDAIGDTRATLNEMEHGRDHDNSQVNMSNYSSPEKQDTPENFYGSSNVDKNEDFNYGSHSMDEESNKTVGIESELESKSKNQDQVDTNNYNLKIDIVDPIPPPIDDTLPLKPKPELDESNANYPSESKKRSKDNTLNDLENCLNEIEKEQKSTSS